MKNLWRSVVILASVALAACVPGGDGAPSSSTTTVPPSSTTVAPPTTTTVAETTTTTVDPTAEFLEAVSEAPSLTAVTSGGFRRWTIDDAGWTAGPLVRFADGPFDVVPFAASTPAGVVYGTPDGAVHLVEGDVDRQVIEAGSTLHDVAIRGDAPVAIVWSEGIAAVDLATGDSESVYEARVEVESASYGGGRVLLIRGSGAQAVPSLVDTLGRPLRLDLLADGNPVSAVLSPDGHQMVFSTDAAVEATVYTLAIGSQGPAAAHAVGLDGPVTSLDTDGVWVAGMAGRRSFLLDTGTGEVFAGPEDVRFMFDRSGRDYLPPGGGGEVVDGRFFGWVRSATAGSIQFDEAEFLTGDDAAAAAEAAGEESPPPNDYFIRDTSEDTRRITLAEAVEIRVQASYPEAGVDWEAIGVDQWLRLLDGDSSAVDFDWYGGGTLPYWVTIEADEATLLEEVYLP